MAWHNRLALCGLLATTCLAAGCSRQAAPVAKAESDPPPAAQALLPAAAPDVPPVPMIPDEPPAEQPPVEQSPAASEPPAGSPPTAEAPKQLAAAPAAEIATRPAAEPPAADSHKPKKDPIKENGPIFENWARPQAAIVITGELAGYVEPCGCAGLENQKGGLSRRQSLLKQLAGEGWPLVPVDLGDLVSRRGIQAELKFQMAVEALRTMNYALAGWGPDDLRLGAGILLSATSDPEGKPSRFASANVGLFELDLESSDRYRIVEQGGRKIGITAVLGKSFQKEIADDNVKLADPVLALEKVVPKLAAAADTLVLLAYAEPAESEALARQFPQFKVVVTAGGNLIPPHEPRRVGDHRAMLIELGHKGMYAITIGLYDDPKRPLRYQRVPLDSRFPDSPEMKSLMTTYQQQLRTLGWQGLDLRPTVHPRGSGAKDPAGHFAGSESCGRCHKKAFAIWQDTPHATATETLARLQPERQFDPECVSCHVTGWKPQEFAPYLTGYTGMDTTPQLKGNGCENCHGPGGGHVAAEAGKDAAVREKMRRLMHLKADDVSCLKCHDLDNSPEFEFSTYWPQVEHKGKD